jgi:hypothetical protein
LPHLVQTFYALVSGKFDPFQISALAIDADVAFLNHASH